MDQPVHNLTTDIAFVINLPVCRGTQAPIPHAYGTGSFVANTAERGERHVEHSHDVEAVCRGVSSDMGLQDMSTLDHWRLTPESKSYL